MAYKKAAGSSKNGRDSAGRRLGFKIYPGQIVSPGNIVLRQRGSKFFSGSGIVIGKDHTMQATKGGCLQVVKKLGRRFLVVL